MNCVPNLSLYVTYLIVQGATTGGGNGWIELVLIEAKDLVAADLLGTSDPYVRVHYGNLKRRTKVGRTTTYQAEIC